MKAQALSKCMFLGLAWLFTIVQVNSSEGVVSGSLAPHDHQHPQCPLWYYYYDTATQNCTCLPNWLIHCDHDGNAFLDFGHLLSYDEGRNVLSRTIPRNLQLPRRKYNVTSAGEVLLPKNISKLNEYMCRPLNRKGYMCSECIDGFGPSMMSSYMGDIMCYDCSEGSGWYGVILYLFIEFIPLTIFYLLILIFHIRITSAPMICFIMYSQLMIIAFQTTADSDSPLNLVKFSKNITLRPMSKVFLTLYGVFNLQFFCFDIDPFCVSSQLTPLHLALLGYVSAFYPFLLTTLIWISFELHDRNFRPLVVLWKPFRRCFARLSRGETLQTYFHPFLYFLTQKLCIKYSLHLKLTKSTIIPWYSNLYLTAVIFSMQIAVLSLVASNLSALLSSQDFYFVCLTFPLSYC